MKGKQKISEFLAELGLPLAQCKQKFTAMDLLLRNDICSIFESKAEKYNMEDITRGTFTASFGYRNRFSVSDVMYALLARMEATVCLGTSGSNPSSFAAEAYLTALDCLTRSKTNLLEGGIDIAKEDLKTIMKQISNFFDLHSVISAGPFLYAIINEGTPNAKYFGRPTWLMLLAQLTLKAHASMSSKKAQVCWKE